MDRRRTDQNPDKFRDLLMGAAQGLALFHPSLDVEYGGAVGDCGYMESGRFWKLFNVLSPPPGIPGLPFPQPGSRRTEALPNNGVLTSSNTSSFSLRGGLPFSSPPFEIDASLNVSRNEASVAFLAYGGQSHEVDVWRDTKVMKDYLLANEDLIVRTYDMTPVATCGLLLLFGTTRVNGWCGGVAHGLGTSVHAKIKVTLAGIDVVDLAATNEVTQQGATTQADWAITRGPLDPAYDSTSHKHCVIVRPVVVRKRERLWRRATTLLEVRSSSGSLQQTPPAQKAGNQITTPAASSTTMSCGVGQPSTSSSSPQESDADSSSTLSDDKYEDVSPNLLAEILDRILVEDNSISTAVADWDIVSTYALAHKRLPDASCKKIYNTRVGNGNRIADVTALLPEAGTFIPIPLPTALPRDRGQTYSPIAHLPHTLNPPRIQAAPQVPVAHLSVPASSSEWVMWVGNVPSDASEDEVRQFFDALDRPRDDESLGGDSEVISVVVLSRSNCAFVHFRTAAGLKYGVQSFNGLPLRPTDPRCPHLLCRAGSEVDTLYAGVAGLRGTDGSRWRKPRSAPSSSGSTSSRSYTTLSDSGSYASTMPTVSSRNSSFLAKPQQGEVPGDPTSVTVDDAAAAAAAGLLAALSLEPSVSGYPPPDPWQLPAAASHQLPPPMPYTNCVTPETDMQQQQEPRALSDWDRDWSSWHAAQQFQAPQYADVPPVPYVGYYYEPPPRHAASISSHGHHSHHSSQWDHALSPTLDAWEDRERHPKERKEKDKERKREREASSRDVFEVDYSRAAPVVVAIADRRPREKERDRDRDREKDSAPRPQRNFAASGSFVSGPRRGPARALPPEASTPSSSVHFGGGAAYLHGGHSGRGDGRQQSHPGELPLPLPVPQTLIKSVSQMDATKYFVLGQIEFYFGARNLATDFFLRQQMDSRGWIPIPLVASFNRVRALSTSGALVREVMGSSALLEVKGDRVRLRDGLWMPYVTQDAVPSTVISEDEDDKPSVLASSVAEVTEDDTDDLDEDDEDDDVVFVMPQS